MKSRDVVLSVYFLVTDCELLSLMKAVSCWENTRIMKFEQIVLDYFVLLQKKNLIKLTGIKQCSTISLVLIVGIKVVIITISEAYLLLISFKKQRKTIGLQLWQLNVYCVQDRSFHLDRCFPKQALSSTVGTNASEGTDTAGPRGIRGVWRSKWKMRKLKFWQPLYLYSSQCIQLPIQCNGQLCTICLLYTSRCV